MNFDAATVDSFFHGRIKVAQHRSGYRFSIDSVILAWYACRIAAQTAVDLGTGCGIIPLIMGHRLPEARIVGVEIQPELSTMARSNVHANGLQQRIAIMTMDMKLLTAEMLGGGVDLVVSNPPFRQKDSGRLNPDPQRAIARHEIRITLAELIETAGRLLSPMGRLLIIYPAERLVDILSGMRSRGIEPKSLRMIHSSRDAQAKRVLARGVKGARAGLQIAPPLVIWGAAGEYSQEVRGMLDA